VRLISGVPSAVAELVRTRRLPANVATVNVAGEACPQSLVESLYALPHISRVIDVYGPTETTVYSTGGIRRPGGRATIGHPLPNEQAISTASCSLFRWRAASHIGRYCAGYLNRPELTRRSSRRCSSLHARLSHR
jgi:non-ribosomal peptide synthetase component F